MTAWETQVNRALSELNDAHSAARMDTPEYRQRRRALLYATLHRQGSASHTVRRPAGVGTGSGVVVQIRATPMRRAVVARPARRWGGTLAWWIIGSGLFIGLLTWTMLH